jgi:hypothetical protein
MRTVKRFIVELTFGQSLDHHLIKKNVRVGHKNIFSNCPPNPGVFCRHFVEIHRWVQPIGGMDFRLDDNSPTLLDRPQKSIGQ